MPHEEKWCHGVQQPPLCDMVQGKRWKMSPCEAFKELFPGAGEQALPSCLCSSAAAEQGTLQGHHQRLLHSGVGVPWVPFGSWICCAKGPSWAMEVVMEFSSWGDSEKSLSMWNTIKEINQEHLPPSSVDILPSRVTSVPLGGHQPSPCSQMLQRFCGHRPRVTPGSAPGSLPKEVLHNRESW